MSRMLNLADRLLERGRNFQTLGREQDALYVLGRLAGLRQLPADVAEETQARLAELLLGRRKYLRARRHLTAALAHRPDSARYHYLMATVLNEDDKGDSQRAADHYRKSLRLDPDQPRCLAEFGLLAVRIGQGEEGLDSVRRAVELAPDEPSFVAALATALQEFDRPEEARTALQAAMFRNPRDARFRKLWDDFQFQRLYQEQRTEQETRAAHESGEDGPTLLPFVCPPRGTTPVIARRKRVRRDAPSPLPPPHVPGRAPLPDRKHA